MFVAFWTCSRRHLSDTADSGFRHALAVHPSTAKLRATRPETVVIYSSVTTCGGVRTFSWDRDICQDTGVKTRDEPRDVQDWVETRRDGHAVKMFQPKPLPRYSYQDTLQHKTATVTRTAVSRPLYISAVTVSHTTVTLSGHYISPASAATAQCQCHHTNLWVTKTPRRQPSSDMRHEETWKAMSQDSLETRRVSRYSTTTLKPRSLKRMAAVDDRIQLGYVFVMFVQRLLSYCRKAPVGHNVSVFCDCK